jgi:F-type H+-transporting ATPase subunit a
MTLLTSFITNSADTLTQISEKVHAEDDWIIHHILDHDFLVFPPINIGGFTIDLSITNKVFMMMVSALILIVILTIAARSNSKSKAPRGFGNFIEMILVFLRDDVIMPAIGHGGERYLPFFFTMFFFILTANLLGLVPFMSTATGSVSITAGLAIITFIMMIALGIKNNGAVGYFKGLIPPGIPVFVLPIMIVVEFLGLLTRPFALCIRLFANMTAGHVVILALIGLIFTLGYGATPVSIGFALFIYLLEILVALLQAYIFTMLSALFIGMSVHQEH